jgi:hypothetical protein
MLADRVRESGGDVLASRDRKSRNCMEGAVVDTGVLGAATGADLMENGIEIVQSPNSGAHVLIIRRR